jgi:hypothetical protein
LVLDLMERLDPAVRLQAATWTVLRMLVETTGCHGVEDLEGNLMRTVTARDAVLVLRLADRFQKSPVP